MIEKTLGGERVGSGNKMKVRMHNYERSTHNLSQGWKSSMQVGTLYPFLVEPALRGDKFEIDLAAGVRTIPTKGVLYGSYKLQLDVYACPVRLYTGILHNNPVNIGMKMDKVLFPQMTITHTDAPQSETTPIPFNNSCLLHYLGLSGLGTGSGTISRQFNAIPVLAYFDIFKNYYANKQEKYAYVITEGAESIISEAEYMYWDDNDIMNYSTPTFGQAELTADEIVNVSDPTLTIRGNYLNINQVKIRAFNDEDTWLNGNLEDAKRVGLVTNYRIDYEDLIDITFNRNYNFRTEDTIQIEYYISKITPKETSLVPFPLDNIDKMRMHLLSHHTMGAPYSINSAHLQPYDAVVNNGNLNELTPLNGLCVKTYQSDLFNNWLSAEYIEGVNGIANITAVNTENGLKIDALNFAEKMYNLLNRIAVSGNTYYDWQDVVYEQTPKPHLESPMYLGGLSQEIVFEEIVSQAATEESPLGELGGRGISRHRKGGKITFKCDEACFIIGIVSITPRINYSQGNRFYMTDILSMDDFHKPALDGIGFQDLIGERLAYFDTFINNDGTIQRHSIGKQPAWLDYMTAVDRVHGDFANGDKSYMVLDRDYEQDMETFGIADATTYIDPAKYNYVFAYAAIDSQNFWVQIQSNIIARRKMSAKLIPNI